MGKNTSNFNRRRARFKLLHQYIQVEMVGRFKYDGDYESGLEGDRRTFIKFRHVKTGRVFFIDFKGNFWVKSKKERGLRVVEVDMEVALAPFRKNKKKPEKIRVKKWKAKGDGVCPYCDRTFKGGYHWVSQGALGIGHTNCVKKIA